MKLKTSRQTCLNEELLIMSPIEMSPNDDIIGDNIINSDEELGDPSNW